MNNEFILGVVYSVVYLQKYHGETKLAYMLWQDSGFTYNDVLQLDLDEDDLETIKHLILD